MTRLLALDLNTRFIACVGSMLLLMLVIGAGKISNNLQDRIEQRLAERTEWSKVTIQMFGHMPFEKKTVWSDIAQENPQLLLQASTVEFKKIPDNH